MALNCNFSSPCPCRRPSTAPASLLKRLYAPTNYGAWGFFGRTLAVIGSFVLGAGTVQMLHAQAKPPAYTLAEIAVKDEDGHKKEFLPEAQRIIKEGGGKYLAGGFNKATALSGAAPPNRVVLIQYENMDALKKWCPVRPPHQPNWDAAFTMSGPRPAPEGAFRFARELGAEFDLA